MIYFPEILIMLLIVTLPTAFQPRVQVFCQLCLPSWVPSALSFHFSDLKCQYPRQTRTVYPLASVQSNTFVHTSNDNSQTRALFCLSLDPASNTTLQPYNHIYFYFQSGFSSRWHTAVYSDLVFSMYSRLRNNNTDFKLFFKNCDILQLSQMFLRILFLQI